MVLTIRRYFQAKNPLVHVALSYQNSNGVLLAMDSSRIKGIDWRGLHYNYNSIPRMEFILRLNTQLFMEKRWTNITRPALTLLINPFKSSNDKILNSYESLWLTNGTIHCHDKGNFTIYRGFPNEIVDEARIIRKDRNTVDFLYLEGIAITFIYRRETWTVEMYEPCFVHLDFSTSFPSTLSQLPFTGTITRCPEPDGIEHGPMFSDLGSPFKYTLKINDSLQITVATSDNNTVTLTEADGVKQFTSRGLNMAFGSGSVHFTIEPGCADTNTVVNASWQLRSGTYATNQLNNVGCRYTLHFPEGTVLMVNVNVNGDQKFDFEPSTLDYQGKITTEERGFSVDQSNMTKTNYAFAAPAPSLFFFFDIVKKLAEVPPNTFKAIIIKYLNYHLDVNQEPLIIPIKDLRDGWGLNFTAANEVVLAVACPNADGFRLASIHVYEDSKNLKRPIATFNELIQQIRRYLQYKNPLVYVALAYQNSHGVLLAMDSSKILGIDWRGIFYYYNNIENLQFNIRIDTRIVWEKQTNITRPTATLLINPLNSSDILNSYQGIWLANGSITCNEEYPGNLTIYQGFPNETVDGSRIIKKDRDKVDFLYLEGDAITFVYRRNSWVHMETCVVSMDFSTTFPYSPSQLPFNGTITRYPDPDGKKRGPIMFYGRQLKYSLKSYDSPQVTVATSDNNTVTFTEADGLKQFTSRGLNMAFSSGSIDFAIEPVVNTSSSSHISYAFAVILLYELN